MIFQHLEKYLKICEEGEATLTNVTSLAAIEEALREMVSFLHQDHYLYTRVRRTLNTMIRGRAVKKGYTKMYW